MFVFFIFSNYVYPQMKHLGLWRPDSTTLNISLSNCEGGHFCLQGSSSQRFLALGFLVSGVAVGWLCLIRACPLIFDLFFRSE